MKAHSGRPLAENLELAVTTLEKTPEAFLVRHRDATLIITAGAGLVASGFCVFHMSGSVAASIYFAPILVVASLVLVLPMAFGCICAAGAVASWRRSRSNPDFATCAGSQRAFAVSQRWAGDAVNPEPRQRSADWLLRNQSELLAAVRDGLGAVDVTLADRETCGFDLLVHGGTRTQIIRCEAGRRPIGAGVGRELQTALAETGCREAVLVAPAGPSPELQRFLEGRSIRVLDAPDLSGGGLEEFRA